LDDKESGRTFMRTSTAPIRFSVRVKPADGRNFRTARTAARLSTTQLDDQQMLCERPFHGIHARLDAAQIEKVTVTITEVATASSRQILRISRRPRSISIASSIAPTKTTNPWSVVTP
jgi:hypothetical protein